MTTPSFSLTVNGIALTLVEFDGKEEMNRLFKYTFTTEIPISGEKLVDMIEGDAIFSIKEFDSSLHTGDIDIPGYIPKASKSNGYWVLDFLPKLHKTTTNNRAEIFFKEDASLDALAIIKSVFQTDILLNDRSPVYDITSTLPTRKLFCQLHESNWNYIARLCDHWGFHFYFDHHTDQIVFADNNQYDQNFNIQFKTTSATADNSPLKILNWKEELRALESYTTIIGHDHANAGTPITSSFPTDTSGLTEAKQTLADVNSQVEANYIAEIRHQENNCLNQLASGKTTIPYVFPGFLINTDDSDFSKALVISTSITARNLNSANTGDAAHFVCNFKAIPDSICFRPTPHYAIPRATNVIGKIISETLDLTTAQRNASGEYKAELLGFANETSAHPWLRKAQTTAGGSSVDIPLNPNTEVLISFIDSNPNCPYIEHALDNSLTLVPVTHENPHQAIISTDGMLVTRSLLGRHDYSATGNQTPRQDNDISGSVKNYYAERGAFDQNSNFIDPSSTSAVEFSHDDEKSGNLIFTRHYGDSVEIREGDKLHWHNGNLYDFGGYWNYNLGNSYEENYLAQNAQLNQKTSPYTNKDINNTDMLKVGGPDFQAVEWHTIEDKVDLTTAQNPDADYDRNFTPSYPFPGGHPSATDTTQPFHKDNVNTSKTFSANSYDFSTECNSIEISDRCNALEITHTNDDTQTVELTVHNGTLRSLNKSYGRKSWSKSWNGAGEHTSESYSDSDISEETTWHSKGDNHKSSYSKTTKNRDSITSESKSYNINTGALASHNITKSDGMGSNVMNFSYGESNVSAFSFGGERKFSLSAQGTASLAISLSGAIDISLEASLKLAVSANTALTVEMEADGAGKIEITNKGLIYSGGGIVLDQLVALSAKSKILNMEQKVTDLDKVAIRLADAEMKLQSHKIAIRAGGIVMDGL